MKNVNKTNFYINKKLYDKDVDKILISKKELYSQKKESFKYFIGYIDNHVIEPLFLRLPQMIGYFKCFDTYKKPMCFTVSDKNMLKKLY